MRLRLVGALLVGGAAAVTGQERRPLSPFDLYRLRTAGNVAVSPDGRWALYRVVAIDSAANRYRSDLWIAATDQRTPPRRLTWRGDVGRAVQPRWEADRLRGAARWSATDLDPTLA